MTGFEWDDEKNRRNRQKHGITFEEAATIFEGPVLVLDDESGSAEVRERSYGLIGGQVVVCVVHTDRQGLIRIISARKATKSERKQFHAYFQNTAG
jgi:uncharacterized DUF497 family protein